MTWALRNAEDLEPEKAVTLRLNLASILGTPDLSDLGTGELIILRASRFALYKVRLQGWIKLLSSIQKPTFVVRVFKMLLKSAALSGIYLLLAVASPASAASWGFSDATLTVQPKGAGVGGGLKEKYKMIHEKTADSLS